MFSRPVRLLTLLLAAMQFAVPAIVSVADGMVSQTSRGLAAHVEDQGQNKCKPPHAADCAICRFLSTVSGQTSTPPADVAGARVVVVPTAAVELIGAPSRGGFDSRAPPTLLD